MNTDGTNSMDSLFSTLVLSIVLASFLTTPAIVAIGYAIAMREALSGR
jgi:hypothetical protein